MGHFSHEPRERAPLTRTGRDGITVTGRGQNKGRKPLVRAAQPPTPPAGQQSRWACDHQTTTHLPGQYQAASPRWRQDRLALLGPHPATRRRLLRAGRNAELCPHLTERPPEGGSSTPTPGAGGPAGQHNAGARPPRRRFDRA